MALEKRWRSQSPEYRAYVDAKSRCTNSKHRLWSYYGGRGIEFRFSNFDEFFACIGARADGLTLDRIDNDGHYESGNVRWATKSEQQYNRRSWTKEWREAVEKAKRYIVICPDGRSVEVFNMAKFCRDHGLSKANLHKTIKTTWTHLGYKAQHA